MPGAIANLMAQGIRTCGVWVVDSSPCNCNGQTDKLRYYQPYYHCSSKYYIKSECLLYFCGRPITEKKLAADFHAHAAASPRDWRRYGEMCILAKDAFRLRIPLPQLPPQPEEEGGQSSCYLHQAQGFLCSGINALCQTFLSTHMSLE